MDIRRAPCEVCGSASSGFHFGVLACEGCKGFYRRAVKFNLVESYKCITGLNECEVSMKSRKCQKCRYEKCLAVGMALNASRTGRPSKVRQAEIKQQLARLCSENRLLPITTTLPPNFLQEHERYRRQASRSELQNTTRIIAHLIEETPSTGAGSPASMANNSSSASAKHPAPAVSELLQTAESFSYLLRQQILENIASYRNLAESNSQSSSHQIMLQGLANSLLTPAAPDFLARLGFYQQLSSAIQNDARKNFNDYGLAGFPEDIYRHYLAMHGSPVPLSVVVPAAPFCLQKQILPPFLATDCPQCCFQNCP